MKFGLIICTRDRPDQLKLCLESLQKMSVPKHVNLHVIVIENAKKEHCKGLVQCFSGQESFTTHYVLETELGIPFARNSGIDTALQLNVDWLGFIDDDETIEKAWLEVFLKEEKRVSADIYHGPVEYSYEVTPLHWMPLFRKIIRPNHTELPEAATNNLIINAKLLKNIPQIEWFDEEMRFSGGEDTEFTRRLVDAGAKIIWLRDMLVREIVPSHRLSEKAVYRRVFRESANLAFIDLKQATVNKKNILLYRIVRIISLLWRLILIGLAKIPIALIRVKIYNVEDGLFHRQRCRIVRILGTIAGLSGFLGQVYRGDV